MYSVLPNDGHYLSRYCPSPSPAECIQVGLKRQYFQVFKFQVPAPCASVSSFIGNIFKFSSLFSSLSQGGHKFTGKLPFFQDVFSLGPGRFLFNRLIITLISERRARGGSSAAAVRPTRVRFSESLAG